MEQDKLMKNIDKLYKAYDLVRHVLYDNMNNEDVKKCLTDIKDCINKLEEKLEY